MIFYNNIILQNKKLFFGLNYWLNTLRESSDSSQQTMLCINAHIFKGQQLITCNGTFFETIILGTIYRPCNEHTCQSWSTWMERIPCGRLCANSFETSTCNYKASEAALCLSKNKRDGCFFVTFCAIFYATLSKLGDI